MNRKKLIIDCDPGHDDAVAILTAMAHPEVFDLLAVTTVCGNHDADSCTRNARIIATAAGCSIRIAQGAGRPLINEPLITDKYHGKTGMDGHHLEPDPSYLAESQNAVPFLRDLLEASDTPVSIAALGPLTNLALLLRLWPELCSKIEVIALMGGGISHGNVTKYAEFNIYVDPEAAQIIFSSGIPIVMCGLDLTEQVALLPTEYEFLRGLGLPGTFFCELMDFYARGSEYFGTEGCIMHDPCALVWLLNPGLFAGKRGCISVTLSGEERGRTVFTPDETGPAFVPDLVRADEVKRIILKAVEQLCVRRNQTVPQTIESEPSNDNQTGGTK